MATVYEIIKGLSQAAANAYDGALDENGDPLKAGLQREEGDAILDKRVMDGFNVKFYGNMMCLSYQAEVQLKEVYANGFEQEVEQRITDIASFLKKEYKKVTGESVTLTTEGELDVDVQSTSRVRNWVQAKMHYKVGGLEKEMNNENTDNKPPTAYWQDFMSQGGWTGDGGKRPQNDTRKKES